MLEQLKAGATAAAAEKVAGAALQKGQDLMRELNDTIPTLKALGFSVSNVRFGMGIVPEIGATLTGSVDTLDPQKLKELIERHRENKTVATILEALRTAANLKDELSAVGFKGVKTDVKVGLPPKAEVTLLTAEPSAAL